MKASDSVNSLTELNKSEGSDPSCFICLSEEPEQGEPLVSSQMLRNCGCRFYVHPVCWNEWIKKKSDYDCPICHKASMLRIHIPPNPVMAVHYEEEQPRNRCSPFKVVAALSCVVVSSFLISAIVQWG